MIFTIDLAERREDGTEFFLRADALSKIDWDQTQFVWINNITPPWIHPDYQRILESLRFRNVFAGLDLWDTYPDVKEFAKAFTGITTVVLNAGLIVSYEKIDAYIKELQKFKVPHIYLRLWPGINNEVHPLFYPVPTERHSESAIQPSHLTTAFQSCAAPKVIIRADGSVTACGGQQLLSDSLYTQSWDELETPQVGPDLCPHCQLVGRTKWHTESGKGGAVVSIHQHAKLPDDIIEI